MICTLLYVPLVSMLTGFHCKNRTEKKPKEIGTNRKKKEQEKKKGEIGGNRTSSS